MLEYFAADVGPKTAVLREGDSTPHGDYELRYSTIDTGAPKPQHIIEAHAPEGHRVGFMRWMGSAPHAIERIEVDPSHQRKGLASAMWNWAQQNARPKPKHSRQRTDQGDAWARSVGGPLPRRQAQHETEEVLFPKKLGSTLEAESVEGYFGGGDGRDRKLLRAAGRGRPRRSPSGDGDVASSIGGGGGAPAGQQQGDADPVGGRSEGPRPVEFHPQAHKDLKALDKPIQKQILGVVDDLANDRDTQTHALTMALKGWYATKASRGHRIVHRRTDEGGIHIGYVGLHEYDKAIRRLTTLNREPGPVTFPYLRNTEGAPNLGSMYGQDVEPHGRYVNYHAGPKPEGDRWETGELTFKNPLHLDYGGNSTEPTHWKHQLSEQYGGKKGKSLSRALLKDGYDGIITHDEYGPSEIVDLTPLQRKASTPTKSESHDPTHGWPKHQRATSLAQEQARIEHPSLTRTVDEEEGTRFLREVLRKAGHPGHEDAFCVIHNGTRSSSNTAVSQETGAIGVSLHPSRADYGTLAHEAAHLLHDRQTGRRFGEAREDHEVHGIGFVNHYARILDENFGDKTPGGNWKGGPGQTLLNEYYSTLAPIGKTSAKRDTMYVGPYHSSLYYDDLGDFRRVLYTSPKSQLVLMTLRPGEDIGEEVHDVDQTIMLRSGRGVVDLDGNKQVFGGEDVVCIPAGVRHNIINSEDGPMTLATVYAPAHHAPGTIHHTKADAKADKGEEFKPVEAKRRPKLKSRVFGPTKGEVDPRLFEGDHMRPEVRTAVLSRLGPVLEPFLGPDWQKVTRVYLAGSESSEWYGNNDFDTLVGVDFDHLGGEPGIPVAGLEEDHVREMLNAALRVGYNASDWWVLVKSDAWHHPESFNLKSNENSPNVTSARTSRPMPSPRSMASLTKSSLTPSSGLEYFGPVPAERFLKIDSFDSSSSTETNPSPSLISPRTQGFQSRLSAGPSGSLESRSMPLARGGDGSSAARSSVELASKNDPFKEAGARTALGSTTTGTTLSGPWGSRTSGTRNSSVLDAPSADALMSYFTWTTTTPAALGERRVASASGDFSVNGTIEGSAPSASSTSSPQWIISPEPPESAPDGYDWAGPFDVTGYVNKNGYDIRKIKPYAAYDITRDEWAVKPPHLPDWDFTQHPLYKPLLAEMKGYADAIEAIDAMPEPHRTQQGRALWEHLHSDRARAFSDEGSGWDDPGNLVEKALVEWGLWDKLVGIRYGQQKTASYPGWGHAKGTMDPADLSRTTPAVVYHQGEDETDRDIEANGVTNPIDVRRQGGKNWIIDGHHRHRKAMELGLSEVPVYVRYPEQEGPPPSLRNAESIPWYEYEHGPGRVGHFPNYREYYGGEQKTASRPEVEFKTTKGRRKGIRHTTISAHVDDRKVGHVRMISEDSEVDDLHVTPNMRGKGIAHALMNEAIDRFGHQTLRLHASPFGKGGLGSEDLQAFYVSHGFEPEEARGKGYMIRRPSSDVIDYTDVGVRHKGVLEYFTASDDDTDYRMQHRPPDADFGAPLHDLTQVYPDDVYTHPHYYSTGEAYDNEAHAIARRVRGKPEAKVKIYRSLPAEYAHQGFRPGDWVSTSQEYAKLHGQHHEDPKHDWPVISTTVPAKHLQTNGDAIAEYGYTGPHKDMPMVSFKGGYHQEIRHDSEGWIKPVKRRKPKTASDYRLQHRAPNEDSGKPYHEYFGGHEDDPVRIYRAAPHDVDYLDSDTWVTTNPDYAHLHAEQYDGSKKWPVMSAEVPAKHVYWDENDSNEFGYQGPRLEEHHLEEHDQEYGLKPFESQAPRRALVRKKKGPQQRWGIGVAHLTSQEHGDSLLHLDRSVALKAVDQALSGAQWSESSRESEDQAADRLNAARGHGPEGTRPVGVIMRAQDGKVDRVALRHHHDDLDSDHPFSGIEIHRSGSFHDLEQDARPMDKTATLIDYFGKAA